MLYYYMLNSNILVSDEPYAMLEQINGEYAKGSSCRIYLLNSITPAKSRACFSVSDASTAFLKSEGLELLKIRPAENNLPEWLVSKIECGRVCSINTCYPNWQQNIGRDLPDKWRINISGLGDVGGILATGLRLLGGGRISSIGLYDRDDNRIKRWVFEAGQVYAPWSGEYPDVYGIDEDEIFDCDMFVFCVSSGVPPLGTNAADVRMAQFEGNSRIIGEYARGARKCGFRGVFAVVSDPVDLLCKAAFIESNRDDTGNMDYMGLNPDMIRGYGLGVMNGRAAFYARSESRLSHYLAEGRAFGPHGRGLVIADSITNYDDELSIYLTQKAENANMDIRSTGFKPYIAPALSSGALSIISTIKGEWHYSATFMGGVFMGSRNRLTNTGIEVEMLDMPERLWSRLQDTYDGLGSII